MFILLIVVMLNRIVMISVIVLSLWLCGERRVVMIVVMMISCSVSMVMLYRVFVLLVKNMLNSIRVNRMVVVRVI